MIKGRRRSRRKKRDKANMNQANTTTTTTSSSNHLHHHHHHHHHSTGVGKMRIRQMINALSFENVLQHHHHNPNIPSVQIIHPHQQHPPQQEQEDKHDIVVQNPPVVEYRTTTTTTTTILPNTNEHDPSTTTTTTSSPNDDIVLLDVSEKSTKSKKKNNNHHHHHANNFFRLPPVFNIFHTHPNKDNHHHHDTNSKSSSTNRKQNNKKNNKTNNNSNGNDTTNELLLSSSGEEKLQQKQQQLKHKGNPTIVYNCTHDSEGSDIFFDTYQSERELNYIEQEATGISISLSNDTTNTSNTNVPVPDILVHRGGFETIILDNNDTKQDYGRQQRLDSSFDSQNDESNMTGVLTGIGNTMTFLSTSSSIVTTTSTTNDKSVDNKNDDAITKDAAIPTIQQQQQQQNSNVVLTEDDYPLKAPPAPSIDELPLRFLRAGKNDVTEGIRRYEQTIQWRTTEKIDTILREPNYNFATIKQYYPHFCHYQGLNGEPCFYEQPPKTNLKALRANGVTLDILLRHYIQITEYQWQYIIRDDMKSSIYVIDLDGIRFGDFVGETVDFVKRASVLSATHYPERAGVVYVINVPVWFKVIWNVIKPIIDEATLQKIFILRGTDEIRTRMQERVAIEHIPPEYGGTSVPLGQSPEEKTLAELIEHNNTLDTAGKVRCDNYLQCKFCTWQPPRSY